jgi:hypothetical protein
VAGSAIGYWYCWEGHKKIMVAVGQCNAVSPYLGHEALCSMPVYVSMVSGIAAT